MLAGPDLKERWTTDESQRRSPAHMPDNLRCQWQRRLRSAARRGV